MSKLEHQTGQGLTRRKLARIKIRSVHRWLGIVSLAFLLVLSLTGIALNHSTDIGLDQKYIASRWLLSWYGMDDPRIQPSFAVIGDSQAATSYVSLVGDRIFVDTRQGIQGIDSLVGAIIIGGTIVVAAHDELFVFSIAGELLDRIGIRSFLTGPAEALGIIEGSPGIVVRSGVTETTFDGETFVHRGPLSSDREVTYSHVVALPDVISREIVTQYRGPGISVERLLYDLHSGQLLARAGTVLLDVAGILVVLLSVTGLIIWLRSRA